MFTQNMFNNMNSHHLECKKKKNENNLSINQGFNYKILQKNNMDKYLSFAEMIQESNNSFLDNNSSVENSSLEQGSKYNKKKDKLSSNLISNLNLINESTIETFEDNNKKQNNENTTNLSGSNGDLLLSLHEQYNKIQSEYEIARRLYLEESNKHAISNQYCACDDTYNSETKKCTSTKLNNNNRIETFVDEEKFFKKINETNKNSIRERKYKNSPLLQNTYSNIKASNSNHENNNINDTKLTIKKKYNNNNIILNDDYNSRNSLINTIIKHGEKLLNTRENLDNMTGQGNANMVGLPNPENNSNEKCEQKIREMSSILDDHNSYDQRYSSEVMLTYKTCDFRCNKQNDLNTLYNDLQEKNAQLTEIIKKINSVVKDTSSNNNLTTSQKNLEIKNINTNMTNLQNDKSNLKKIHGSFTKTNAIYDDSKMKYISSHYKYIALLLASGALVGITFSQMK